MSKFCPKCYRRTSNGVCVVHGKVEAVESEVLDAITEAIYVAIKDNANTDYAKTEIVSKAVADIVELILNQTGSDLL